jgi:hypothetical protein
VSVGKEASVDWAESMKVASVRRLSMRGSMRRLCHSKNGAMAPQCVAYCEQPMAVASRSIFRDLANAIAATRRRAETEPSKTVSSKRFRSG